MLSNVLQLIKAGRMFGIFVDFFKNYKIDEFHCAHFFL